MIVWIEHGTGIGGVAAAGEAEMLADGLPNNFAAGIQNAGDNGGIELRYVPLQHRRAIHHRHARDTDIVLDSDALAGQDAGRGAFDGALLIPSVQRVLRSLGAIATRTRVANRQRWLGQLVEAPIRLKNSTHQTSK